MLACTPAQWLPTIPEGTLCLPHNYLPPALELTDGTSQVPKNKTIVVLQVTCLFCIYENGFSHFQMRHC